jgi:hypothetical protein
MGSLSIIIQGMYQVFSLTPPIKMQFKREYQALITAYPVGVDTLCYNVGSRRAAGKAGHGLSGNAGQESPGTIFE